MTRILNVPVDDAEVFARLSSTNRPLGMRAGPPTFGILRQTFFDTADAALAAQHMTLALRSDADGTNTVILAETQEVSLGGAVKRDEYETPMVSGGLYGTLAGTSEVASRVRAIVDPDALRPQLAVDIDREVRDLRSGLLRRPSHRLILDDVIAHTRDSTRTFREATVIEMGPTSMSLDTLATRLRAQHGLEPDGRVTYERIGSALVSSRAAGRPTVPHGVRFAVLLVQDGEVALLESAEGLVLPGGRGSGESIVREYVGDVLGGPSPREVELDFLGFTALRVGSDDLEVWLHVPQTGTSSDDSFVWVPARSSLERAGAPRLRDPGLVAALLVLARSEIGRRLLREAPAPLGGPPRMLPLGTRPVSAKPGDAPEDFLDLDLSILDFNQRVLELAEDPAVPLLERFRFLSIFSSNLDEFHVVRMASIKLEIAHGRSDEYVALSPAVLRDLVAIRVRALQARQYGLLERELRPALARHGVRIRSWEELDEAERAGLTEYYSRDVHPLLTPLRLSTSAVRTFPRLVSLGMALAAVLRRAEEEGSELGYVAIPRDLPRWVPVPGGRDVIAIEEVIGANAGRLFAAGVTEVHAFRASRAADVDIDEDASGSLLNAVADEVEERAYKPVIRLEIPSSMPADLRAYLIKEIRAEQSLAGATLTRSDVYEVDGPLDLRCAAELCGVEIEGGLYLPHTPRRPLPEGRSIFETLTERDVLVHHPFHDFDATVGRFLREAAADADVVSIKLTLYRTGRRSPVMEALLHALGAGKDVSVFVELKARFDEESNIEWTQRLVEAGAHVITGVPGYKTHAKTALVVRREAGGIKRYVHVGTGNYNAQTARFYTDLGLMSADPDLGADLNDFFNELTGSERPPGKRFRRLLVAPNSLVQELERMVEREIQHAREGRPAQIRAKMNGLADRKVVESLYRASEAGVSVDLIVRSICTLRPGVPGLSQNIRVRSILGRLLEHGRIFHFANGGEPEYYIGSADWRSRNLRKRVEVVTPVLDPAARTVLAEILEAELGDPRAWVLRADGAYERLRGEGPGAQERFMHFEAVGTP